MPLILALGRQRQVDFCKFKASLVNIASSRPAGTKGDPVSKIPTTKKRKAKKTDESILRSFLLAPHWSQGLWTWEYSSVHPGHIGWSLRYSKAAFQQGGHACQAGLPA